MPDHPIPSPRWPRRAVLGGAGLAIAGVVSGCADGGDESAAQAADREGGSAAPGPRLEAPEILSTIDWGARIPEGHQQTLYERPSYLVIHHTATPNVTDGSRQAAVDIAQRVQSQHINQQWGDSGQHFTMSRGGYPLEGRHGSLYTLQGGQNFMLGVHALGFNAYALGIECEGFYMLNPPPQSLYAGLVKLASYICQQYGLPPSRIIGHRDIVKTSCCGDAFYAKLPVLREDVRLSLESGEYHVTEGFGADNLFEDSEIDSENYKEYRGRADG